MNDIPAFTGCGGVSTLILREIPYKNTAFVMVRAFERDTLDEHLQEAASLCAFAGAKSVFASAEGTELYPGREPDYKMLRLKLECCVAGEESLSFEPLTADNMEEYIRIYNACFGDMLSAETLSEKKIVPCIDNAHRQCGIYYMNGKPAAVSDVEFADADGSAELNAVAVLPECRGGTGAEIVKKIASDCADRGIKTLWINVMSTNAAALRLYEKSGAALEKVLSCWYKVA